MRQCDLGYEHEDPEPEAVVIDDGTAEAAAASSVADIEVARINAERDVEVAKIETRTRSAEDEATMAALMARIEVLEAAAAPPPAPEPEPVVIPVPAPDTSADPADGALPDVVKTGKGKKDKGWWSGYR